MKNIQLITFLVVSQVLSIAILGSENKPNQIVPASDFQGMNTQVLIASGPVGTGRIQELIPGHSVYFKDKEIAFHPTKPDTLMIFTGPVGTGQVREVSLNEFPKFINS